MVIMLNPSLLKVSFWHKKDFTQLTKRQAVFHCHLTLGVSRPINRCCSVYSYRRLHDVLFLIICILETIFLITDIFPHSSRNYIQREHFQSFFSSVKIKLIIFIFTIDNKLSAINFNRLQPLFFCSVAHADTESHHRSLRHL